MAQNYYLALKIHNPGDAFAYHTIHDECPKEYARDLLGPLAQINLFVGQNNAGKSRFLRLMYANPNMPGLSSNMPSAVTFENLKQVTNADPTGLKDLWLKLNLGTAWGAIYGQQGELVDSLLPPNDDVIFWQRVAWLVYNTACWRTQSGAHNGMHNYQEVVERFEKAPNSPAHQKFHERRRVYVPILRGLRPLDQASNDVYRDKTKVDYLRGLDEPQGGWPIVTGLSLYQDLKIMLLGTPEQRAMVRSLEKFIGDCFFDGTTIGLVPREPVRGEAGANTIELIVGEGVQRPIHDWGDGLQTLLICLFDAFTHKEPGLYFIEEPDANLHPSYQRALLEAFRRLSQHQFFLTTHSNHFLDMASDSDGVGVFRFSRAVGQSGDRFEVRAATQLDRTVLQDLGARPSSTLLTNASIWVEGITDRHYLKAFMRQYLRELRAGTPEETSRAQRYEALREDRHYSFVEYQGANLVHWTFEDDSDTQAIRAVFLCARAFVIADGDVANKGDRVERFTAMLQDRFHLLSCKEIENLVPNSLLQAFAKAQLGDEYTWNPDQSDGPPARWGVGSYLDTATGKAGFFTAPGKAPDKGTSKTTATIRQKGQLCDFVVAALDGSSGESALLAEVRELCEKVFHHIAQANGVSIP